jgi:uncharacterized repeat protein (TIGR01451 family)
MFRRCTPFLVALALSCAFSASAAAQAGWELDTHTDPTYLRPGGLGTLVIRLFNVGATASNGAVTVTDTLPPGVTATSAGTLLLPLKIIAPEEDQPKFAEGWNCTGNGPGGEVEGATVVTCSGKEGFSFAGGGGTPGGETTVPGHFDPELAIGIKAPSSEGTIAQPNRVTAVGGGALEAASVQRPMTVSSSPAPFGFASASAWFSNADGTIDTQAGSHPYEATFLFNMNTIITHEALTGVRDAGGGEIRNLTFDLPPGFVGYPYAVPRCTRVQFNGLNCPAASQVGVTRNFAPGELAGATGGIGGTATPVYNLVPPAGQPAEFGFQLESTNTTIGASLHSGSNYSLSSQTNNIPQLEVTGSIVTLWGEPSNPSHAEWHAGGVANLEEKPFLTLPTSCEGPQEYSLTVNSWTDPNLVAHTSFLSHNAQGEPTGFTGCGQLSFGTSLFTAPDTSNADTPTGLTVEVKPRLGGLLEAEGLGTTDIKETTVTLPPGVAINPGQAAGLQACGPAEDGLTTPAEEAEGKEDAGPPSCPLASKVGTDEITLPILKENLTGNVYVLNSNPPELKLLIAASGEGVNVKLIAEVHLNEQTGQLVTTVVTGYSRFPHIPQAPVSAFKLAFSGGAQAALATPTRCGVYTSESVFTPWASPYVASVYPTGSFGITAGTDGAPCPGAGPLPYTPTMTAGATTDQAGGYTDFSLLLQAPDDQQRTSRLQFKTPEGLLGMISKVPLCTSAEAEANACPAASQIGHTVVASGPGPYPLVVPQPGQPPAPIYLTEGYEGAPYGLSIVVPLHVGPFTLPTQRVRARIEVDELTAQLTITTDPLPQYVAGVPTDLRSINAVIDKPGFMFNPTGCEPQAFSGTAFGTEGAQTPIGSHFQMGSCRALKFQPNFKASTSGKTSRANGASLGAKIVYPTGELGANQASSQSNIQSVKVELPKKLPSRLTTLQKACTAAQFDANPAGCPAASVVGHAVVHTPVLPVPLEGPAYFVSNGNEAFPNLIMVLQGYGVTIHLVGDTFINKQGITSSTFKRVPDVPIGSFELTLPEGPYSALAANGNLCKAKLTMPTHFVAQNGEELDQKVPITVTGCAKAKKAKAKKKSKHSARKRSAKGMRKRAGKQGR